MLFHLGIIQAHLMRWPSPKSACPASDLDGQTSGRKTPRPLPAGTPEPISRNLSLCLGKPNSNITLILLSMPALDTTWMEILCHKV